MTTLAKQPLLLGDHTERRRCAPSLAAASPPGLDAEALLKMNGNCVIPQGKGEKAGAVNEYN